MFPLMMDFLWGIMPLALFHMTNIKKRKFSYIEPVFMFLGAFLIYALSISYNYFQAHNGIYYINNIDPVALNLTGAQYEAYYIASLDPVNDIFHPHHLLHVPLARLWISILRFFGSSVDSLTLVSYMSSFFGALTLGVFYTLMRRRLKLGIMPSIIATSLPAFSFAFWFYSSVVEIYMIPMFFLMLILYFLTGEHVTWGTFLAVGAIHGIAMLFHQSSVLFLPVVLAAIFLYGKTSKRGVFKNIIAYAVVVPVVAIPYLLVMKFGLNLGSPGEMFNWLTKYGHESSYWSPLSLHSIPDAIRGFLRSIIGMHFVFALKDIPAYPDFDSVASWQIAYSFLTRNLSKPVVYLLVFLSAAMFISIAAMIRLRVRGFKTAMLNHPVLFSLSLVWFCSYALFFMFWVPSNPDYWIPQSVCGWLIFTMLWISRKSKFTLAGLIVVSTLLFVVNLVGSIAPLHNPNNDYYYQYAKILAQVATKDDVVITREHHLYSAYIKRYVGCNHVCLDLVYEHNGNDEDFKKAIELIIDGNLYDGKRVLVSRDAFMWRSDNYILFEKGKTDARILVMDVLNKYETFWNWTWNEQLGFYIVSCDVIKEAPR
jgi:hypothetical protein